MLYPYRPTAVKNRQRFNFGVVYPRTYSEAQGGTDACTMQTECLLMGQENTQCKVRVRFLRMTERAVAKVKSPARALDEIRPEDLELAPKVEIGGKSYLSWQEAVEETIEIPEFNLHALAGQTTPWPFRFSARQEKEGIRDEVDNIAGVICREQVRMSGQIELTVKARQPGLFQLTVRIHNDSPAVSGTVAREVALLQSLVSAHTILDAREGEFISLVDPPEEYQAFVRGCENVGTWPVLVGEAGRRNAMLSSPIILYDYPEVAPESPGDLYDGAEIDEILSLRIMTLTEEEKREMRESDERARRILERTEALPEEQWIKLHGVLRGLRSTTGESS